MTMKRVFFKTIEAVADQSGAMESGDHFKNGASLKTSRGNLRKVCFALLAASILSTANVSAQQKGDMAVGGHFSLVGMGIGPKFQYNVAKRIRLEGAFTYYLLVSESSTFVDDSYRLNSWWDITANAHFLIPVGKVVLYPIVGLGVNRIGYKETVGYYYEEEKGSLTLPVINLGFGTEFNLGEHIAFNLELKIRAMALFTAGIAYKF